MRLDASAISIKMQENLNFIGIVFWPPKNLNLLLNRNLKMLKTPEFEFLIEYDALTRLLDLYDLSTLNHRRRSKVRGACCMPTVMGVECI